MAGKLEEERLAKQSLRMASQPALAFIFARSKITIITTYFEPNNVVIVDIASGPILTQQRIEIW